MDYEEGCLLLTVLVLFALSCSRDEKPLHHLEQQVHQLEE